MMFLKTAVLGLVASVLYVTPALADDTNEKDRLVADIAELFSDAIQYYVDNNDFDTENFKSKLDGKIKKLEELLESNSDAQISEKLSQSIAEATKTVLVPRGIIDAEKLKKDIRQFYHNVGDWLGDKTNELIDWTKVKFPKILD